MKQFLAFRLSDLFERAHSLWWRIYWQKERIKGQATNEARFLAELEHSGALARQLQCGVSVRTHSRSRKIKSCARVLITGPLWRRILVVEHFRPAILAGLSVINSVPTHDPRIWGSLQTYPNISFSTLLVFQIAHFLATWNFSYMCPR